jgi:hypothetical protein
MTLHPSEGRAGCPCGYLRTAEQSQRLVAIRDSWGNPGIPKDSGRKQAMQMWKAKSASHIRTASATAARDGRSEYKSRDPAIVFPMAESAQKDFAISFSDG